jgi:hypothetical protein
MSEKRQRAIAKRLKRKPARMREKARRRKEAWKARHRPEMTFEQFAEAMERTGQLSGHQK